MTGYSGPIQGVCEGIFDGPHATPRESEEGPIFLGIGNVTSDGRLDLSEIRHVSEQEFPIWTRRVTPSPMMLSSRMKRHCTDTLEFQRTFAAASGGAWR